MSGNLEPREQRMANLRAGQAMAEARRWKALATGLADALYELSATDAHPLNNAQVLTALNAYQETMNAKQHLATEAI